MRGYRGCQDSRGWQGCRDSCRFSCRHAVYWMILIVVINDNCFVRQVASSPDVLKDYCEEETFSANCDSDEVIVMEVARYGRMQTGSCLSSSYGSIGCSRDLLPFLDAFCSGQPQCRLNVRDLLVHNPCPRELRGYLEAQYTCTKVISPDPQRCHQRSAFVVTPPSGYLSNYITERTGCGNIDAPWHIQASPGQRINVTLMDFGTVSTGAGGGQQKDSTGGNVCQVLAIIKDRMVSTTETICTGKYRLTNVYYSASHDIEVRMVLKSRRDENGRYALLKYDVIGCADIPATNDLWFKRYSPAVGIVGCNRRSDTWRLSCENDAWVGPMGNCSDGMPDATSDAFRNGLLSLPIGAKVIITAIVAGFIGLVVLIVGLLIVRRKMSLCRKPATGAGADLYFQKSNASVDYSSYPRLPGNPVRTEALPVLSKAMPAQIRVGGGYGGRTWELQLDDDQRPSTYPLRMRPDGSPPRYVDHIYESPKSIRRDLQQLMATSSGEDSSLQYFEIDTSRPTRTNTGGAMDHYQIQYRNE